jgi:hypothetical protein
MQRAGTLALGSLKMPGNSGIFGSLQVYFFALAGGVSLVGVMV